MNKTKIKWKALNWLWLVLIGIGASASAGVAALTPQQQAVVNRIAASHRLNRTLVDSFRCRYQNRWTDYSAQKPEGEEVVKNGEYAFSGNKIYNREDIEGQEADRLEFAQNGNVRQQAFGIKNRSVLQGSLGQKELIPGSRDPWEQVGSSTSESLDHLDSKKMRIESVERDPETGMIAVGLSAELPGGQLYRQTLHYDEKKGYMPVRMEIQIGDQMHGKGNVEKILEYEMDGQTFYVPARYSAEAWMGDRKIREEHYAVEESSVEINPDLPDDLFRIEIRPDDIVVDKDIDVELANPFGKDFMAAETGRSIRAMEAVSVETQPAEEGALLLQKSIRFSNGVVLELVYIPPGKFIMGSPEEEIGRPLYLLDRIKDGLKRPKDEGPQHEVVISKGFYMGKVEVTEAQFKSFDPGYRNDIVPSCSGPDYPVLVGWNNAQEFCDWLGKQMGTVVRLPSEEEWEYACRAGTQTRFFWGEDEESAGQYANLADQAALKNDPEGYKGSSLNTDDGYIRTAPIGQFKPNSWGLHDMLGNVAEWCQDDYYAEAYQCKVDGRLPQGEVGIKIRRGGGYYDVIALGRCAARSSGGDRLGGFRVVVEPATLKDNVKVIGAALQKEPSSVKLKEEPQDRKTWVWIGAGVLVILGGGVFLGKIRRRKKAV